MSLEQQLPREEARQKQKRQESAWGGKRVNSGALQRPFTKDSSGL